MTDTKDLATIDPLSPALALSSSDEYKAVYNRWEAMIRSGALPAHVKNPSIAISITRYGAAYGWDEMRSLNAIYLVNGKPALSSQAMRGLVFERIPGACIEQVSSTNNGCVVKARRAPEDDWVEFTFNAEDAKAAGCLTKSGPWRSYPSDMYFARASARACRRMFPDAVEGAYALEELRDVGRVSQVRTRDILPPSVTGEPEPAAIDCDVIETDPEPPEEQAEPACDVCGQDVCEPNCPGAQ